MLTQFLCGRLDIRELFSGYRQEIKGSHTAHSAITIGDGLFYYLSDVLAGLYRRCFCPGIFSVAPWVILLPMYTMLMSCEYSLLMQILNKRQKETNDFMILISMVSVSFCLWLAG